jgi:hypothetical protein
MIVNGLSDSVGNAFETRQQINIDFNFGSSGINSLLRLSRETGEVELVELTHFGGSQYGLSLILDGGTGDLFKFNNGGTFVGTFMDGDFNGDGIVDAADYVVWRKTDRTQDGYHLWRTHFGQSAGSGAAFDTERSSAAVPESRTWVLLLAAMLSYLALMPRCSTRG